MEYNLLDKVNDPSDLKKLTNDQLDELSGEIRHFLIHSISKTGGHLASNLGTVELTVAMHKVFDCPNDKFIFDVGHQCYTHKLLTNRKDRFDSLRQKGGIAGFPKPSESDYDSFISGHASTSISAAYGIAKAFELQNKKNYAVAMIGDGAFTGGEAYEALNNAGRSKTRLIVILNHNDMSISKNVGAFARYLSTIRSKPSYLKLKSIVQKILDHTPLIGKPIKHWLEDSKSTLKMILYRSTFFEELGYTYLGPIDGHDMKQLINVLARAKEANSPVLIQVETIKGKGYPFAEENPGAYHAIAGFDVLNGGDNVVMSD
ncbi:MAG: 1-deoxy-D-xylulose-5-phosphate synthase N-terminal domain-containing protein, partial [Oscillospiraceae bacterium]